MNEVIKSKLLSCVSFLSLIWRMIPCKAREILMVGQLLLESRDRNPSKGLARLFLIRDRLDWIINKRAMEYGNGEHPKHRLIGYHNFFVNRIANGQNVIDLGCGYGAVARSIAIAYPSSIVIGIDQDKGRLKQAVKNNALPNLSFFEGDATKYLPLPEVKWDIVVLSNILEHINERVIFLKKIQKSIKASRYLIRVPMFERDWQMAMRKELTVDFRSDLDHKIEHTFEEFEFEISQSGLSISEVVMKWGEIWADCYISKTL